jgi:hypothetical protein
MRMKDDRGVAHPPEIQMHPQPHRTVARKVLEVASEFQVFIPGGRFSRNEPESLWLARVLSWQASSDFVDGVRCEETCAPAAHI